MAPVMVTGSNRPANFSPSPSLWGDQFINYTSNPQVKEKYSKGIEVLKNDVRSMLTTPGRKMVDIMDLIDTNEIEEKIQQFFNLNTNYENETYDLYTVALHFRLFRQHGYPISCEMFGKWIDGNGKFQENLKSDAKGLLSLYEASYLRIHGETLLDEALVFATANLKSMAPNLGSPLRKQVKHALVQTLHFGIPRVEAHHFISIYEEEQHKNQTLLRFAKLDFNLLQILHKEELHQLSRWWKEFDFFTKLPYSRDRIVECFFWSLAVFYEPQYSRARIMLAKSFAMVTLLDDTYDSYGTIEEIEILTEAIQRLGQEKEIFMVLDSYDDCRVEYMERQHRLSFYNNVLFGIKDLCTLIDPISPVRSLLCFGPYQRYEVPICSHLSSLRVLDALSIRFYDFPIKVLELDQLRYLALTCNADLPPTISKLEFLEFLIVLRHQSIKSSGNSMYFLPMEVWDMRELKHLQVTGSSLPNPDSRDKLLPNLLALLDVDARCCTKSVLERIPNLEKLGIQIELAPDGPPSSFFEDDISYLEKLRSLKCVVVKPTLISPPPLPILPLGLEKLTLSGFGYPWEEMCKIDQLPNLLTLKLRCYAFRGPKWISHGCYAFNDHGSYKFKKLRYLLIEDTDLIDWILLYGCSFGYIRRIILKNCYRLPCIPYRFWHMVLVDLVDCNPSAAEYNNKRFAPEPYRHVHAKNSWDKE